MSDAPGPASSPPTVSVIIPHYHDLAGLDLCLSALEAQTYPRDALEIIVADNDSPEGADAVANVIRGRAALVVVKERGPGPARNGAVAESRGRILAFTDSDCVPDPAWLAEGVAALSAFDLVGGRVKVVVDNPEHLTMAEAFEVVFAFDNEGYVRRQGFTVTANLFCPRAVFDRIGGFISWVAMEDVNWSHRARAAGYRLGFAGAAVVGHPARRTWADLATKTRRSNVGMYKHMAERPAGRARWILKCLAMPLSAVAHTPRVLAADRLTGWDQKSKALAGLFRVRLLRMTNGLQRLWHD